MTYVKQNWENLPSENTPITAGRLSHMETQYDEAVEFTIDAVSPGGLAGDFWVPAPDEVPGSYVLGGAPYPNAPVPVDYGGVRNVESHLVSRAVFTSPGWSAGSYLELSRVGRHVFVDGVLERTEESSEASFLGIGFVPNGFLPKRIYSGNNGSASDSFSVKLLSAGLKETFPISSNLPISVLIRDSGLIDIRNTFDSTFGKVVVSGGYVVDSLLEMPDILNLPLFEGTNYKSWFQSHDLQEGVQFSVDYETGRNPDIFSVSVHGGSGEYGTSELSREFARRTGASYYDLDIHQGSDYVAAHLTSTVFDGPRAVALSIPSLKCASFHGAANEPGMTGGWTYVGGSDAPRRAKVIQALQDAGFQAVDAVTGGFPKYAGTAQSNICNLGVNGGVQLELDPPLRQSFFVGSSARANRVNTTPIFENYIQAVVTAFQD